MTLLDRNQSGLEAPTTELCVALEAGMAERFRRECRIARCSRRPFRYQTSAPFEELDLELDDGEAHAVLFKHVGQHIEAARGVRPAFLLDSHREIETYRRILDRGVLGTPICYGAVAEPRDTRFWLFLERVSGAHLWEYRDLEVWCSVARWLAGFHARCVALTDATPYAGAPLRHDAAFYRTWAERAWRFAFRRQPQRLGRLRRLDRLVERYDAVIARLEQVPRTLIHGEFFASNVLVSTVTGSEGSPVLRVCAVDWESLGDGPGATDLAAIAAGWTGEDRDRIATAYFEEQRDAGWYASKEDLIEALEVCHLQLAIQMVGWAEDWQPPREHRQDWLTEALDAAARLGVLRKASD